jgi:hypothetical protein
MLDDYDRNEEPRSARPGIDPFAIAAGLIRNDLRIIPLVGVVFAVAAVLQGLAETQSVFKELSLLSVSRTFQLLAISFIVVRWRRKLEHSRGKLVGSAGVVAKILIGGFVFSLALNAPLQGALRTSIPAVVSVCLFFFVIALFWTLRLYFYFAVCGLLGGTMREALSATLLLGKRDPTAAIRSLVAPIAITALIASLVSIPSPDGRSQVWGTIGLAAEAIFWILGTYTGLAFALALIDETAWRVAGLDPYRAERLKTIETQGRQSRFTWLSPRSGVMAFILAIAVWISNVVQMLNLPPSAGIKVERCDVKDHAIYLSIEIDDPEHRFRGFNPFAFSLASQTGYEVSTGTEMVSLTQDGPRLTGGEFLELVSAQTGPIKLHYRFRSNKTGETLHSMDNLWLWYNLHPLARLKPEIFQAGNSVQHQ